MTSNNSNGIKKRILNFIHIATPINSLEEKEKFFKYSKYNPQFIYPTVTQPNRKVPKYKEKLHESFIEQNIEVLTNETSRIYECLYDADTYNLAQNILKTNLAPLKRQDLKTLEQEFIKMFRLLRINYKIKFSDRYGFNFRPNYLKKRILVSNHAVLDYLPIYAVVLHELTHVIRRMNTSYNNNYPKRNYLPTEEGLACYMSDNCIPHELAQYPLYQHAADYIGTLISKENSFINVYEYYRSLGFNKDLAWQRTARTKFGLKDTSQPGTIHKPGMYFFNEIKVSKLPKKDIIKLFSGRITLNQLNEIEKYSGKIPIEKIKLLFNIYK